MPPKGRNKWAHEVNQVRVTIIPDIFSQLSTRHPFRHELEGFEGDALEGYNVGMIEALPHHGFLAKCLQNLSARDDLAEDREDDTYLFNLYPIACGGYSEPFDTNICHPQGSFVDITESAVCDRLRGVD